MNAQELAVWSMALSSIAAVALARAADLIARPSIPQFQGVAYHSVVFLLVLILSGVLRQLAPGIGAAKLQMAQVLAGPICVGLSDLWIRSWLNAAQRDRIMSAALRTSAAVLPLAGVSCLVLPQPWRLPGAAAVSLVGGLLTLWLAARAWRLGDHLAGVMTAGCLLTLPAIAGLYATAMQLPGMGLPAHIAVAICAALCNGFTGFVLWRRDRHERRTRLEHDTPLQFDPVTQLHTGTSLVGKLVRAQRRRRRTRHDGAVLAIMVFDLERVVQQVGAAGLNEMFVRMAGRIQRQVGVVNLVGRYYDRCFVSLVETIQSPAWLRTIGLRVATSLRRPMELTSPSGHQVEIRADVGVGVVHLLPGPAAVEDVLVRSAWPRRHGQCVRVQPFETPKPEEQSRSSKPISAGAGADVRLACHGHIDAGGSHGGRCHGRAGPNYTCTINFRVRPIRSCAASGWFSPKQSPSCSPHISS